VLIVEDMRPVRPGWLPLLALDPDFEFDSSPDGVEALEKLSKKEYEIVIVAAQAPGAHTVQLTQELERRCIPRIVVVSGSGSIQHAVQASGLDTCAIVTRPVDVETLRLTMHRALRLRQMQREAAALRADLQARYAFSNIRSDNKRLREQIAGAANSAANVLIEGEPGTGKDHVARVIHYASRRPGPFIVLGCSALPEALLDGELFGREQGWTAGRFAGAEGGTFFLDEVAALPPGLQVKVGHILHERRLENASGETISLNARVIAGSRMLRRQVQHHRFCQALYKRLSVLRIELPPLRERREDIPSLAAHFVEKYARPDGLPTRVGPTTMKVLLDYPWPGNVRELENAIHRACVTCRAEAIEPENLPLEITRHGRPRSCPTIALDRPLPGLVRDIMASVENQYIRQALKSTHGNVSRCARLCGMSRRSITAKLSKYGLDRGLFCPAFLSGEREDR
jgi:DNA-binding NtrC family response regulator